MKFFLIAILFFVINIGKASDGNTPVPIDNYLVSYTLVKSHTIETIKAIWKKNRIPK